MNRTFTTACVHCNGLGFMQYHDNCTHCGGYGDTTRLIVFLQNAWSPLYAGGVWPRRSWIRSLARSRSGQMLKSLIGEEFSVCENTTEIVGDKSSSVVPPDVSHIKKVIRYRNPELIIACGNQARDVVSEIWQGPMVAVPHPASRTLQSGLFNFVREFVVDDRVQSKGGRIQVAMSNDRSWPSRFKITQLATAGKVSAS